MMQIKVEFVKNGKTVKLAISESEIKAAKDVTLLITTKIKNALYMLER